MALRANGIRTDYAIHHLVLMAFVGPRPHGLEACHWDDAPSNNRVENLRWDTRSGNIRDCVRNGNHHMARKTECPQQHPYTPENTYIRPNGARVCRECNRIYKDVNREEIRAKGRKYMRRKRAMAKRMEAA